MNTITEPTPEPETTPDTLPRTVAEAIASMPEHEAVPPIKCACGNLFNQTGNKKTHYGIYRCNVCLSEEATDRYERIKDEASKQESFARTHLPDGRVRRFTLESYEGQPGLN